MGWVGLGLGGWLMHIFASWKLQIGFHNRSDGCGNLKSWAIHHYPLAFTTNTAIIMCSYINAKCLSISCKTNTSTSLDEWATQHLIRVLMMGDDNALVRHLSKALILELKQITMYLPLHLRCLTLPFRMNGPTGMVQNGTFSKGTEIVTFITLTLLTGPASLSQMSS